MQVFILMYIAYILNSIAKKLIALGNAYKLRSGQFEDILLNILHEEKNSDKLKPEDFAKIIKLHRRSSMEEAVLRSIESSFCKAPGYSIQEYYYIRNIKYKKTCKSVSKIICGHNGKSPALKVACR